ncbi:MAG: cytochrome c biogenesis protein CcsA [Syntrophales bacterium]
MLASVSYTQGVIFNREKSVAWGGRFIILGLLPHVAALLLRWAYVHHGPYLLKYEVLSSNALIVLSFFLLAAHKYPRLRFLGMFVAPLAFLMIGLGLFTDLSIKRLPPTFANVWLFFHIIFAKLASSAFLIALALSVAYLLKIRNAGFKFLARLPQPEQLDEYIYKFVAFGFCFWTIMIAAGSIWAYQSWGRYWGWDPMETWSLIAWLMFGGYLHLRLFFNWKGMKGVIVLFLAFAVSFLTVFFLPFLVNSLHSEYLM